MLNPLGQILWQSWNLEVLNSSACCIQGLVLASTTPSGAAGLNLWVATSLQTSVTKKNHIMIHHSRSITVMK